VKFIGHITGRRRCSKDERRRLSEVERLNNETSRIMRENEVALENGKPLPDLDVIRRYGGYREYAQAVGGPII